MPHIHDDRQAAEDVAVGGGALNAGRYDPWGAPIDSPISPFGFAGELQGEGGLVSLRARWYTPQRGVFTARDPFAGWAERPYSQHSFQYGYSNPVWFTDPDGRFVKDSTANWLLVRELSSTILKIADMHGKNSPYAAATGIDKDTLAVIMGAIIAIESNWAEMLGRRRISDFVANPYTFIITTNDPLGAMPDRRRAYARMMPTGEYSFNNPSTGIANMRLSRIRNLLNDECIYLVFSKFLRKQGDDTYLAGNYADTHAIYDMVAFDFWRQSPKNILNGLDLLAATILEGASQLRSLGINLSMFNIANINYYPPDRWSERGTPSVQTLFARMGRRQPDNIGIGGIRTVKNLANSASALGIAIPNTFELYATSVHPIDSRVQEFRTELDWYNEYGKQVE